MANFFQPGNETREGTQTSTPSPADQQMAMFKAQLFQALLNNAAGNGPTFKSFVQGGPATRPVPAGLGNGLADVLTAMKQPGAFTSTQTGNLELQGATPSMFSDLAQLGLLGALMYKSGALGALGGGIMDYILKPLGGALGIGNEKIGPGSLGASSTGDSGLDQWINTEYGGGSDPWQMIPGGAIGDVPGNYPGLLDVLMAGG